MNTHNAKNELSVAGLAIWSLIKARPEQLDVFADAMVHALDGIKGFTPRGPPHGDQATYGKGWCLDATARGCWRISRNPF